MDFKLTKITTPSGHYTISTIPGDKSVSHRAVIFGSLAQGTSHFLNFLDSEDCLNTLSIFSALGVHSQFDEQTKSLAIIGQGVEGLKNPGVPLDVGNSGTGIRLITGVLCGLSFKTIINGDSSIQKRPMKRIISPLSQMGAHVTGQNRPQSLDIFPPLTIQGGHPLLPISYTLPVASAQVKSAVLLASLFSNATTEVIEPQPTRNHTEVFLTAFGADYKKVGISHFCSGKNTLVPPNQPLVIPSDISSASFFMVLGCLIPGMTLTLSNIGINPTRDGILTALTAMGATLTVSKKDNAGFEAIADITCHYSELTNIDLDPALIPNLIDEIPILAVCALFSKGIFRVHQAKELRHKESDRIATIGEMIQGLGGEFIEYEDGFDVIGQKINSKPIKVDSHGDHRIAMAGIIGGLLSAKNGAVLNCDCIKTSFPNFFDLIKSISTLSPT